VVAGNVSYPYAVHRFKGLCVFPVHSGPAVQQNRTRFRDAVEDDVDKLLESLSVSLMIAELAELDKQTYKET
jgi:hypothetical protein